MTSCLKNMKSEFVKTLLVLIWANFILWGHPFLNGPVDRFFVKHSHLLVAEQVEVELEEITTILYEFIGETKQPLVSWESLFPLYTKYHREDLKLEPRGLSVYWKIPFKDPWGQEFRYHFPGINYKDSFDLFSIGEDRLEGTTDDINNWDNKKSWKKAYEKSDRWLFILAICWFYSREAMLCLGILWLFSELFKMDRIKIKD